MNWRNTKLLKLGTKPLRCMGGVIFPPPYWPKRMGGAHISHSMWHSHCHFQRKGQTGAFYPYTDPLRGGFLILVFLRHALPLPKISFSCLGGQKASLLPIQHHFLGPVQWALWEMPVLGCPRCRQQGVHMGEAAKYVKYPECPGLSGRYLGLYVENTIWVGSSTGKCSWYCFPVENATEREIQGWDCSVLCLLGWGVVITHISELSYCAISMDPSCSKGTDQSWSRSSGSSSVVIWE